MATSPDTQSFPAAVLEWWHVLVFVGTLFVGFVLGNAKQRWTLEQQRERLRELERRIGEVEKNFNADSRTLGLVQNELQHIRSTLIDIKRKLEA